MAKDKSNKKAKNDQEDDEHGSKGSIIDQLETLDTDWSDTEEKSFGDVTDGKYQCKISSCTINNAKSESSRLQVSFELTILGPSTDFRGRKLFTHFGIEDEEQRGYLRGALAKLGVEWPPKAKDLPDTLSSIENTFCQVTARTKKKKDAVTEEIVERQNIWLDRALDSSDVEDITDEEDSSVAPAAEEKAPAPATAVKKPKKADAPAPAEDCAEEAEENCEAEAETAADTTDAEGIDVKFTDEEMTPGNKKKADELAALHDFDPSDYSSKADLLADVGEYVGLTGEYAKPIKLINAIAEVKPKTKKK